MNESTRDELARAQLHAVRALTRTLAANAFYASRVRAFNERTVPSLPDFVATVPLTTKAELAADQRDHPPYGTLLTYPLDRYTRFSQTSGTTGTPLRWLDTPESWSWMVDNWTLVFRAAEVGGGDCILFAFSFGPFLGFWTAFEAGTRLGARCLPGGGMSSAARLQALLDHRVTVLCCTPTYALHLSEVARTLGLDLREACVRRLLVAGEPGGSLPQLRARLEQTWPGAQVRDHHGLTETGPVSYECPARPGVLHIMEHAFFPEIIAPDGNDPLPPGQRGELVLTNLGRTGSPVLRYRTGDLVQGEYAEPCACGSSELALVGGILGRTDDMVLVRGVNLYPSAVDELVRQLPEVVEYRVELRTEAALTEIKLIIEPRPNVEAGALCHRLSEAMRIAFQLRVPVETVAPDTLPRFEMKAQRWIRKDDSGT